MASSSGFAQTRAVSVLDPEFTEIEKVYKTFDLRPVSELEHLKGLIAQRVRDHFKGANHWIEMVTVVGTDTLFDWYEDFRPQINDMRIYTLEHTALLVKVSGENLVPLIDDNVDDPQMSIFVYQGYKSMPRKSMILADVAGQGDSGDLGRRILGQGEVVRAFGQCDLFITTIGKRRLEYCVTLDGARL